MRLTRVSVSFLAVIASFFSSVDPLPLLNSIAGDGYLRERRLPAQAAGTASHAKELALSPPGDALAHLADAPGFAALHNPVARRRHVEALGAVIVYVVWLFWMLVASDCVRMDVSYRSAHERTRRSSWRRPGTGARAAARPS